jgi:hypothetical protein
VFDKKYNSKCLLSSVYIAAAYQIVNENIVTFPNRVLHHRKF